MVENLSGFGVGKFIYTARTEQAEHPSCERVEFDSLLHTSDFIIICCALNNSTHNLFNKATFEKMKKTAILINTARGPIVNMDDLEDALEQKEIAAAGLDVTTPEPIPVNHRLLGLSNCVILPHIGSATHEARSAMSQLAALNIVTALKGDPMPSELFL